MNGPVLLLLALTVHLGGVDLDTAPSATMSVYSQGRPTYRWGYESVDDRGRYRFVDHSSAAETGRDVLVVQGVHDLDAVYAVAYGVEDLAIASFFAVQEQLRRTSSSGSGLIPASSVRLGIAEDATPDRESPGDLNLDGRGNGSSPELDGGSSSGDSSNEVFFQWRPGEIVVSWPAAAHMVVLRY